MSARWTAWHFFFGLLLRRRGPRGIELREEVPLSAEPPRVDYLLVRKPVATEQPGSDAAETLRWLWPRLPRVSVVEYKSPSHPYRPAHLDRLWGYVHIHFANQRTLPRSSGEGAAPSPHAEEAADLRVREDLCAVLIVARRTPSLEADIASMGLRWEDCGSGYFRVHGGLFALYVVEIDVVGPAEGDDLLEPVPQIGPSPRKETCPWPRRERGGVLMYGGSASNAGQGRVSERGRREICGTGSILARSWQAGDGSGPTVLDGARGLQGGTDEHSGNGRL